MDNPSPEEENIIKDVRNLFRLGNLKKKQLVLQLKTKDTFLDQKNKIKQLKIEHLEILETFLD